MTADTYYNLLIKVHVNHEDFFVIGCDLNLKYKSYCDVDRCFVVYTQTFSKYQIKHGLTMTICCLYISPTVDTWLLGNKRERTDTLDKQGLNPLS